MYVHFMILITFVTIFLMILLIKKLARRSCYSLGELIVSWKNETGISGIVSKWVLTVNVDGQKYVSENASEVNDGDVVVMKVTGLPFKEEYDYNLSYVRVGSTKLLTLHEGQHSNDNTKFLSLEDVSSLSLTYGSWAVTDRCSSRGKLIEERTLAGTTEEQDSSTDCCYQTEWVENCSFNRTTKKYKLIQTREAAGSCDDLNTRRSAYVGLCEISSNDRCGVGTGRLDGRCKDKDACCSEDGYCGTEYCGVYGHQANYDGDNKISWAYS